MFYKPLVGGMWDPSLIFYKGYYYMLSMHYEEIGKWDGMWAARSKDGVHWEDMGRVLVGDLQICKMFPHIAEDGSVVVNHGSLSGRPGTDNDTIRFYRSEDMIHWEHLYDNHPDPAYYEPYTRWDHMYVSKVDDTYYGYVVAVPLPECQSAVGLMKSKDGIHFDIFAPPKFEWDGLPSWKMYEGGGFEKIGEKYYYIGGTVGYWGEWGYGLYTFVSDSPEGPFHPDKEAFRLCGFSDLPDRTFIQNLAAFFRDKNGDVLVSNAILAGGPDRVFLLPVRKAVVDAEGHLRLGYWQNNEYAKGKEIALAPSMLKLTDATLPYPDSIPCKMEVHDDLTVKLDTADPQGIQIVDCHAMVDFDLPLDFEKGVILEGRFIAEKFRTQPKEATWPGCWRPTTFGVSFGETDQLTTALVMDIGPEYKRRSYVQKIRMQDGKLVERVNIDTTGEGCATVRGVSDKEWHTFKLFVRENMYELYADDMLVQTFETLERPVQKIGFIFQNCRCELRDLKLYEMNV